MPVSAAQLCADDKLDLRSENNSIRFSVEIADSAESRAVGLMNREALDKFSGMLFVYPKSQPVAFWMRNTLIYLDMLFIDSRGVVSSIHENAVPLDETSIFGGDAIQYVLEINGGMSKALGIGVGSEVRHPAISGHEVIWACD